jgi:hypothetical protein
MILPEELVTLVKISISKLALIFCLSAEKVFLSPLFIEHTIKELGISHIPVMLNFKGSAGSRIIVIGYDAEPEGEQFSVRVHLPSYFTFAFVSSSFLQEVMVKKKTKSRLDKYIFDFII